MEKHIGRLLTKKEVIYHIDGNKKNNKISNLELFESTGKHTATKHIRRDKHGKFK